MKKIITFVGLFYLLVLLSPTLLKAQDNFQTYSPIEWVDPSYLGTGQEFFLSKYFYPKAFRQMPEYRQMPVIMIGDRLQDEKEIYLKYNSDEDYYSLILPTAEYYYNWEDEDGPFLIFDVYTKEFVSENLISMRSSFIPVNENLEDLMGMDYYPHSFVVYYYQCEITPITNGEWRMRFFIYPRRDAQLYTERIGIEIGTWGPYGLLENAERIEILKYKTGPSGIQELPYSETPSAPCTIAGLGSAASPYKIQYLCQLQTLRDEVNAGDDKTGKWYSLAKDLDLSSISNWIPIGNSPSTPFNGYFKGEGNSIKNLTISSNEDNRALFGFVGPYATITNVAIKGAQVQGNYNLACLVANNEGTVSNCEVSGEISGMRNIGLVVGDNKGMITKCFATGLLSSNSMNVCAIGGICGISGIGDGIMGYTAISNCYTNVTIHGGDCAGGILGVDAGRNNTIENCYSMGEVAVPVGYAGGILGRFGFSGTSSKIKNCVSLMRDVNSGEYPAQRIVGNAANGRIENCYAARDMSVNGRTISSNSLASENGRDIYRTEVIQNQPFWETTVGFNFSSIWNLNPLTNYPVLIGVSKSLIRTQSNESNTEEQLQVTETTTARLDQNVPNPFSGNTSIGYYIPETAKQANLYIYNLLGQQVKGATITTRGQGEYTINNSELTVGTYIYKLVVDGQIIGTKKMMLAK